jgi:hypothetical protein
MWHVGGTAGEHDGGSHLAAAAPARVMGKTPSQVITCLVGATATYTLRICDLTSIGDRGQHMPRLASGVRLQAWRAVVAVVVGVIAAAVVGGGLARRRRGGGVRLSSGLPGDERW